MVQTEERILTAIIHDTPCSLLADILRHVEGQKKPPHGEREPRHVFPSGEEVITDPWDWWTWQEAARTAVASTRSGACRAMLHSVYRLQKSLPVIRDRRLEQRLASILEASNEELTND